MTVARKGYLDRLACERCSCEIANNAGRPFKATADEPPFGGGATRDLDPGEAPPAGNPDTCPCWCHDTFKRFAR